MHVSVGVRKQRRIVGSCMPPRCKKRRQIEPIAYRKKKVREAVPSNIWSGNFYLQPTNLPAIQFHPRSRDNGHEKCLSWQQAKDCPLCQGQVRLQEGAPGRDQGSAGTQGGS